MLMPSGNAGVMGNVTGQALEQPTYAAKTEPNQHMHACQITSDVW